MNGVDPLSFHRLRTAIASRSRRSQCHTAGRERRRDRAEHVIVQMNLADADDAATSAAGAVGAAMTSGEAITDA